MTSREIRDSFLQFFKEKGHTIVPSAPVVPYDDPTLLFTNAGMNQFKDVFLGKGTRPYKRAADTQKCVRAGGKHNDLEEVGFDTYHHTFFEMLGNWSFGDYYKKEAIGWAWELATKVWKMPKERIYATVFETDEEAMELWKSETDIDHSHILKFDAKDNFWEMGETGPCGPCSEMHFDFTENGCKPEDVNAGLEDVIEFWNLVFIQYNRDSSGKLSPLPQKHIDTGMGFERVVRLLQKKNSNYETDVFSPIIDEIKKITGKKYEGEYIAPMNVIADHIRTLVFSISDGAVPSNEGRGYVLRRVLRRALRFATKLEFNEPILYKLVDVVVDQMGYIFPEIVEKREFAKKIILSEEESFNQTLTRGIELFNEVFLQVSEKIKNGGENVFPGEEAFKLYDTFGFPSDLTELMAKEKGLDVDMKRFNEEMRKQKEMARSSRKDSKGANEVAVKPSKELKINYDPYSSKDKEINTILYEAAGEDGKVSYLFLKDNPFYSESGGQVSDTGIVTIGDKKVSVKDSKKDYIVTEKIRDVKPDLEVTAAIDSERRKDIERNHSATHLMNAALKIVLGDHVKQAGSLVNEEYLRFDFPNFAKLTDEEIKKIEDIVNEKVSASIEVKTMVDVPIEEANNIPGVRKQFGEKYGDKVRVVIMDPEFSIEFCGGTHVSNTGDIGFFKIIKEESISAGVRRIFAKTGAGTEALINDRAKEIEKIVSEFGNTLEIDEVKKNVSAISGSNSEIYLAQTEILKKLSNLKEKALEEKKRNEKEQLMKNLEKYKTEIDALIDKADESLGFKFIASEMKVNSADEFKELGEEIRKKLLGVSLVASQINGKISLVSTVSDDLIKEKKISAGDIIKDIAKTLGGGGGGRPQLATAGAKDIEKLPEVISRFKEFLKEKYSL
ncbi:alanine--tRNA ligase [soil metagenome]